MLKRACMIVVLILGTADLLSAQAVRGRLLDASSAEPVAGALIVLLDADGAEVTSTVTSARGTYHLRAPGAGVFRLRAERIGFQSSLSNDITLLANQTMTEELTASSSAIVLPVLSVESETECRVRPEEGEATYVLWEEARKALEVTERTAADYRFDAITYQRHVNLWGEALEQGDVQFVSYAGRHPWRSVPIEELEEHGYAREAEEGTYFYGPDAEVLLSDQFLDSHCSATGLATTTWSSAWRSNRCGRSMAGWTWTGSCGWTVRRRSSAPSSFGTPAFHDRRISAPVPDPTDRWSSIGCPTAAGSCGTGGSGHRPDLEIEARRRS